MTIYKAIEKAKAKLIAKVKKEGLYENFGNAEVREIKDKYDPMFNYDISIDERDRQLNALEMFSDWCAEYCG